MSGRSKSFTRESACIRVGASSHEFCKGCLILYLSKPLYLFSMCVSVTSRSNLPQTLFLLETRTSVPFTKVLFYIHSLGFILPFDLISFPHILSSLLPSIFPPPYFPGPDLRLLTAFLLQLIQMFILRNV